MEETYATDHLYLAGYLVCCGHRLIRTEPKRGRIAFVFHQSPILSGHVAGFLAGGQVEARRFAFEILRLKKLIPRRLSSREADPESLTMEKSKNHETERANSE